MGPYFITRFVCSDGKECVCLTTVPTQALCNNFQVFELPSAFRNTRKLEQIIILKRLLFQNVKIMPKSQCPKIKGVIRNVLINADDIWKEVPRVMDKNDVVQVRCTLTCKPLAFQFSLKPESPYKSKVNLPIQKTSSFRYQGTCIDKSAYSTIQIIILANCVQCRDHLSCFARFGDICSI